MAKFDLKKAILENKATFFGSLTEGQFSWMTQDTGQQIGSQDENIIPVYMFDDKGKYYYENDYEGYGVFGGKDYYDLVAEMNGYTADDAEKFGGTFGELRGIGIKLAFDELEPKNGGPVLFPALVTKPDKFNYKSHDFTQEAETDPNQSWYEPEEDEEDNSFDLDDDEDYGYNDEEEELDEVKETKQPTKMKKSEFKAKIKEMIDADQSITTEEAFKIAEKFADYMTKFYGIGDQEFTVVRGSVNGPKFDLALDGDRNKGGRYVISTSGNIINVAADNVVHAHYNKSNGYLGSPFYEGKKSNKIKVSELKSKIKEMVLAEYERDVDYTDETAGYDFLAELEDMLNEADETEKDTAEVDTTDVAVDDTETVTTSTEVEVDPNVKAVQDALTQAQVAAQKLGDKKLTDQIGNTITFFTREHVVEKPKTAVAEADEMEEGKKEDLNESMFPMLKKILK